MKLYGNPVLPFSRLVETVAQFTKTNYDFQVVDLFSGQSFNSESSSKWTFTCGNSTCSELKVFSDRPIWHFGMTVQIEVQSVFVLSRPFWLKTVHIDDRPLSSLRTVRFDWKNSRLFERRTSFRMVRDYESKTSDTLCKFWKWFLGWFGCDLKVPL